MYNALCKYSYGLPVWTKSKLFKELTIIERYSYLLQLYPSALEREREIFAHCSPYSLKKLSFLKIKSDSYEVSPFTYYKKNYLHVFNYYDSEQLNNVQNINYLLS